MGAVWQASLDFSASSYCITRSTVGRITKLCPNTNEIYLLSKSANILWKCKTFYSNTTSFSHFHGLRTPREEIAFTERLKIQSQSQIFRYGQSIFCLPHQPSFSDIFDLYLHWVSVVHAHFQAKKTHLLFHFGAIFILHKDIGMDGWSRK